MKDLNYYVNESKKTDFDKIENLGNSWIKEWGPSFCGNILSAIMKGIKKGMEENKYTKDDKFQKRCEDCINKIIDEINEDIY